MWHLDGLDVPDANSCRLGVAIVSASAVVHGLLKALGVVMASFVVDTIDAAAPSWVARLC